MRKLILLLLTFSFFAIGVIAQTPEMFKYQAILRDGDGNVIADEAVAIEIDILKGGIDGMSIFTEMHNVTTNSQGLVNLNIGSVEEMGDIVWNSDTYFIKITIDGTVMGTSQLLSVPYALHAKTADSLIGGVNETDPVYSTSEAVNITANDIINLSNLSGINTGDQDISGIAINQQAIQDTASQIREDIAGIAVNEQAIQDTAAQIRSDIPTNNNQLTNGAGYITDYTETDPGIPAGTQMGEMQYWNGTEWVLVAATSMEGAYLRMVGGVPTWMGGEMPVVEVTNPTTGEIWMDRNLGAEQVATNMADSDAFGDLYQWGRGKDGHESRLSGTSTTLSPGDTPGHDNFIIADVSPNDWRNPQNDNLWQGIAGTNNPCPSDYRIPTEAEWDAERASWTSNDKIGAFASPLKFTVGGRRSHFDGSFEVVGTSGYYWTSTVSTIYSRAIYIIEGDSQLYSFMRGAALSIRCIKD